MSIVSDREVNELYRRLEGHSEKKLRSLKARYKVLKNTDWKYFVCCLLIYNKTHNAADGLDLADCYKDGYGCQANADYALSLYKYLAGTETEEAIIAQHHAGIISYSMKRIDDAEKYFKLAEKNNFAPSIYFLGNIYFEDKKDFLKAKENYTKAAALGNPYAKTTLKTSPEYSEKQLISAKNHFSKGERIKGETALKKAKGFALISESSDAIIKVAKAYFERKLTDEAYELYETVADMGNSEALDSVIKMLIDNLGGNKDVLEKLNKYMKLADEKKINEYAELVHKKGMIYKKTDIDKAIEFLKISAEMKYIPSLYELGAIYDFGLKKGNYKEAEKWYLMAAESSSDKYENEIKKAQAYLGQLYYFGEGGVEKDEDKALHYASMVADSNSLAMRVVGWILGNKKDYEKAFEYYTRAIEQGNNAAKTDLGKLYYFGRGVEKNLDKAAELFYEAALIGRKLAFDYLKKTESHLAPIYLGNLYLAGKHVEKSIQTALEYYAKIDSDDYQLVKDSLKKVEEYIKKEKSGAEQNDLMLSLAMLCVKNFKEQLRENDIEKLSEYAELLYMKGLEYKDPKYKGSDINIAIEYYEMAAEAGSLYAQNELGDIYYCFDWNEESRSHEKARKWYLTLVETYLHSDPIHFLEDEDLAGNALDRLAWIYYYGVNGVERDLDTALKYASQAVERNYRPAMQTLGDIYKAKGNYTEALVHYTRAVENGLEYVNEDIGRLYYNGLGVEQDIDKASELYYKAGSLYYLKKSESHLAPIYLGDLYFNGNARKKDINTALEYYAKADSDDYQLIKENLYKAEEQINAEINSGKSIDEYSNSMFSLASLYLKNIDEENWARAFKLLCNLAEKDTDNKAKAEKLLSELYKTEAPIPDEAIQWLYRQMIVGKSVAEKQLIAIANGNNANSYLAANRLADYYFDAKKYEAAEPWLKIIADKGVKDANSRYAYLLYKNGDTDNAIRILEAERVKGSEIAIRFLAEIYFKERKKEIVGIVNDIEEILARTDDSEEQKKWLDLWNQAKLYSLIDDVSSIANEISKNRSDLNSVFKGNILAKLDAVNYVSVDAVYDLAIEAEENEEYENAILFYYVAARLGSRKAKYTLINMSFSQTRYFIRIEDHTI